MNSIDTVFEWLLAATLRASVLAVVILSLQFVLRRWLSAGWRHALWLPMLAVLVLPALPEAPFGLFPRSAVRPPPVAATVAATDSLGGISERAAPGTVAAPVIDPADPAAYVVASDGPAETSERAAPAPASTPEVAAKLNPFALAWLAGACGVLAAGMIGYRRNLRRIRINATAPDRVLQAVINGAATDAGLKRAPQVMVSPVVTSPAVTGLLRPLLLLPANFPEGFSAVETRLILLHEFSHLKRLDLPLNWLMCVLQATHWFNPLLWFAFARMRVDREAACDARVLSIDATDRRAEYGGALLKLQCVTPTRALSLGFVGIFERGSEIQSRIRGISTHRPRHIARQVAEGAIVTLLMVFGVTKGQQSADRPGQKNAQAEVPAESPVANSKALEEHSAGKPAATSQPEKAAAALPVNNAAKEALTNKLRTIIIPRINFEDISVEEAVDFLRLRAVELDVKELDTAQKGLNFVIRLGINPDLRIKELKLKEVPLGTAIQYICDQTKLDYTVDDFTVTLVPKNEAKPAPAVAVNGAAKEALTNKLQTIVIPRIDFEDISVEEAVDFLRLRAAELDVKELDPAKKGLNFVIRLGINPDLRIKELKLKDVPLGTALKYICDQTKLDYTVDDFAVTLAAKNEAKPAPAVAVNGAAKEALTNKLQTIIIPRIDFEEVSVEEAVEFLRLRAAELDTMELDPARKGVNFVVRKQLPGNPRIQRMRLTNVPLAVVLKYICDQTKLDYTVDDFAVTLVPKNEAGVDPAVPANRAGEEVAPAAPAVDSKRAATLAAVFDALKKGDAAALAANLPELSDEEAAAMVQRIAAQWGDLSKLTTTEEFPAQLDKGAMKTIAHWGTKATTAGKWLNLRSDAAPGRWLRIGLLFAKDDSQPRQFLALEWPADAK